MSDDELQGWWAMSAQALMRMLREVEAGATADMVYTEHYANSAIEDHADDWDEE